MAKPKIEFKYWFIRRDDAGFITEVAVRFNEIATGKDSKNNDIIVRNKLNKSDLFSIQKPTKKTINVIEHFIYTSADFGNIKTDTELHNFMVDEVKKLTSYAPTVEQTNKK